MPRGCRSLRMRVWTGKAVEGRVGPAGAPVHRLDVGLLGLGVREQGGRMVTDPPASSSVRLG